jgi:hypothetical protein
MDVSKIDETYIFKISIKIHFFYVSIDIKILFFRVSVSIETSRSYCTVRSHEMLETLKNFGYFFNRLKLWLFRTVQDFIIKVDQLQKIVIAEKHPQNFKWSLWKSHH